MHFLSLDQGKDDSREALFHQRPHTVLVPIPHLLGPTAERHVAHQVIPKCHPISKDTPRGPPSSASPSSPGESGFNDGDVRERPDALPRVRGPALLRVLDEELDKLFGATRDRLLVPPERGHAERAVPRAPPARVLPDVDEADELLSAVRHVPPRPICARPHGVCGVHTRRRQSRPRSDGNGWVWRRSH